MESNQDISRTFSINRYHDGFVDTHVQEFVCEEPLLIRVEDRPYSVVMRTPGDEVAHAAGFCLSEGLVSSPEDIVSIGFCRDIDKNSVMVTLNEARKALVREKLERGCFISQTSCGICGREMIEDLTGHLKRIDDEESRITDKQVIECVDKFSQQQKYYLRTRATHAVMLFDSGLNIIAKAEDAGRHNAMDKAVGAVFLKNCLSHTHSAVLSSRISFEMIQKAVRAGIPILISMGNPTSMAVELGLQLGITLICLDKQSGFIVACGEERVRAE